MSVAVECEDEDVYIVGGANSAGQAAMFMSRDGQVGDAAGARAARWRRRCRYYLIQQIEANDNIKVRTCTEVVDTVGERRPPDGPGVCSTGRPARPRTSTATGCACFIGAEPRTDWLDGVVARDDHGFILSGPDLTDVSGWTLDRPPHHLETSVPGVFVAGDVRAESAKRVAAAVGEGSMAVMLVHRYLAEA